MPELKVIISLSAVVFLILYWVAAFLLIYHLTRFGVGTQPKRFAGVFLFGSLVLFAATIVFYSNIQLL